MKAPKEIKQWINRVKRRHAKKNGVVKWLFENPEMERKMANRKKLSGCSSMVEQ